MDFKNQDEKGPLRAKGGHEMGIDTILSFAALALYGVTIYKCVKYGRSWRCWEYYTGVTLAMIAVFIRTHILLS